MQCVVSANLSFQNSTTQSTDALEYWVTGFVESFHHLRGYGIPSSFKCISESSVPLLFVSKADECSVSSRESLHVPLDFSEFDTHCSECPLFVHSMSLHIDMKMID